MTCSVDGCETAIVSRGWCVKHYARWLKHGTTDLVRKPTLFDDFLRLEGIETDDCVEWPYANCKGYGRVGYRGRVYQTHRLACFRAHGYPPIDTMQAAHYCGNPACINYRHLRWATPTENSADREMHGTCLLGEQLPASKLTEAAVRDIRQQVAAGVPQVRLAEKYRVHPPAIHRVVHRKRWGWLDANSTETNPKEKVSK